MNTFGAIKLGFSGNRIVVYGSVAAGSYIDLPYDPVDKRSLLIFRGQYQSLIDIDQYEIISGKLILATDLEQDEQLTIVYVGYDASARINFPATLGDDGKIKPEQIPDIAKSRPRNYLINSNFLVNQRVGPFTHTYQANSNAGSFTVDRWLVDSFGSNASSALVTQKSSNTPALLQYGQFSLRIQNNSSGTGSNWLKQRIEGSLADFLGKPFTASIRCVKDITDSATLSKTIGVECRVIYYPDSIIPSGNLISGFQTVIPWTSIGNVSTVSTVLSASGTFPTVNTVQGSYTTPGIIEVQFKFQGPTNGGSYAILAQQAQFTMTTSVVDYYSKEIAEEFDDCRRFYENTYKDGVAPGSSDPATLHSGVRVMSPNVSQTTHVFATRKRVAPLITIYNPAFLNMSGSGEDSTRSSSDPLYISLINTSWVTQNDVALFCPNIQWNGTYRNSLVLYHLVADAEIY